jgi:hypothetical protein
MRWLMIALLASLAALLLAAAGVARHIWLQRARHRSKSDTGPVPGPVPGPAAGAAFDPAEEIDHELEL